MRPKCRGVLPLGYKLLWGIKEVMTELCFLQQSFRRFGPSYPIISLDADPHLGAVVIACYRRSGSCAPLGSGGDIDGILPL